jgi:hypothetical protein
VSDIEWSEAHGGSEVAWAVLRWLEDGEKEVRWWLGYSGRLTPKERSTIRGGDFRAFRRILPPAFSPGQWLDVGKNLRIQIALVELNKGTYRCTIGKVRDFRTHGPFRMPSRRTEDGEIETEPEGVEDELLAKFADDAKR